MSSRDVKTGLNRIMAVVGALLVLGLLGCGSGETAQNPPPAPPPTSGSGAPPPAAEPEPEPAPDPAKLVARGKSVYNQVCIACHSSDPAQDGNLGPSIAGASLEVLTAKVLRNEYPEGYAPKRETRNMVPLPHLEKDLPALAAYLESVGG